MAGYVTELAKLAKDRGWEIQHTKGGHYRLVHPDIKKPVFTAATPSDRRAFMNTFSTMRRYERAFGVNLNLEQKLAHGRKGLEDFNLKFAEDDSRIYTVVCSKCASLLEILQSATSSPVAMGTLAIKFRKRGWHIGQKRGEDTCPQCIAESITNGMAIVDKLPVVVAKTATKTPSKLFSGLYEGEKDRLDALQAKTRAAKRRILQTLNKVYIDGLGYIPGEDDATVAKKLNVGLELVQVVRYDLFGNANSTSGLAVFRRELQALMLEFQSYVNMATKFETRMNNLMRWAKVVDSELTCENPLPKLASVIVEEEEKNDV